MLALFGLSALAFSAFAYCGRPCGNRNPGLFLDADSHFAPWRSNALEDFVERRVVQPQCFRGFALIERPPR